MTGAVEAKQRGDDQVQPLGFDDAIGMAGWFGYAKAIGPHGHVWRPGRKPESSIQKGVQYRQVTLFAQGEGQVQQRHGVEFPLAADIGGDAARAPKALQASYAFIRRQRGAPLFV